MHTLTLRQAGTHTLVLVLLILAMMISGVEFLLRIHPIASQLPNSDFGGEHSQLETQFARLDRVIAEGEPINCFLLGDSLVWLGIDPEAFQTAYTGATGQPLHCFNFGVSAMPAAAAKELADYLVATYDPAVLIYGVHARDLAVPVSDKESRIIIDNSWFRYRQGKITPSNWVREHSAILRNVDYLRALLQADTRTMRNMLGTEYRQLHGFDPKTTPSLDINVQPDPENPVLQEGFKWYWDYKIREENLAAVRNIAGLSDRDLQVFIVVLPTHPNFLSFFRNGEQDYARFVSSIEETVKPTESQFWVWDSGIDIPIDGWYDYSHMNLKGADLYSTWLGNKVGTFMRSGSQTAQ